MMRVTVQGSRALVVAVDFGPNQVVRTLQGKILSWPTRTSICIGVDKHIEDRFGSVVNHSLCSFGAGGGGKLGHE